MITSKVVRHPQSALPEYASILRKGNWAQVLGALEDGMLAPNPVRKLLIPSSKRVQ